MHRSASELHKALGRRAETLGRRAFRLSSEAASAGLQVIVVRHGQSTNNLIQDEVEKRMRCDGLPPDQAAAIWMSQRVHDPALSAKGLEEASCAAQELGKYLGSRGAAALVVPSPMLRALQTALPIVQTLRCACTVSPLVYETGGMYAQDVTGFVNRPGLTADEISRRFSLFRTSELPAQGPWNGNSKKETFDEAIIRAANAAKWIKTNDYTREMMARPAQSRGPLILVIHSTFIDLLLKTLLKFPHSDTRGVMHVSNCSLTEIFLPAPLITHDEGYATLNYLNRNHFVT
jgi:broad specificity phosphatase PhoE